MNEGVHMRRKIFLLLSTILLFVIAACSDDEVTPSERFDTYVDQWIDHDFKKMYDMLATETVEDYPAEEFIDRYKKIYEDLGITDLQIMYEELSKEKLNNAMDEGVATIPIAVEMESIAGPIDFDYEATLIQEGEEDEKNWFLKWDPGFIFPELKDGGEISITSETAKRGEILDRNDMPLAINDIVYEIGIVPGKLSSNEEADIQLIAKLLNMSIEKIETELSADWVEPDRYVPLKKITKSEEDILAQLQQIEAIDRREVTGRIYPLNEAASHLVGYIGQITAEELENAEPGVYQANDVIGKRGLEQLHEEKLKGENGIKIIVINDEEDMVIAEKPVIDGENVSVTIDVNIQEKIYESYDGGAGTTAAINPKSGEALALVSSPGFNPNDFLYGISQNEREKLENDPQTPLINRFSATFAPGSAIKPITAAIGLENGSITPGEGVDIKGKTWDNGKGWGDYQVRRVSETSKPVDIADALIRSDNIFFAMKAVEMGDKSLVEGLERFGFEEKLPFPYPFTTSTISSSGTLSGEVEAANTSYGQAEIEVSSLHLAIAYTPFINNGNIIKPTLLSSEETGEIWKEQVMKEEHALLIQDILRDVVHKGTAKIANKDDLAISGKTGTAELKLSADSDGQENAWFVGYPADDQDILIAMMMEDTKDIGASSFVAEKVADLLIEFKND